MSNFCAHRASQSATRNICPREDWFDHLCVGSEALAFGNNHPVDTRESVRIEPEDRIEIGCELTGDGLEPGLTQVAIIGAAEDQRDAFLDRGGVPFLDC